MDADGNLYVGLHSRPEILVYDTSGTLLQTIVVKEPGVSSATNIAIRPGTNQAFATVSGAGAGRGSATVERGLTCIAAADRQPN